MIRRPVSEIFRPSESLRVVDVPEEDNYRDFGYSIAYFEDADGNPIPEHGNTAIFRIFPGGMTEPVFVTKPEKEATFTVIVVQGTGKMIRVTQDGHVDEIPFEADDKIVVRPGEAYSYVNTGDEDVILYDTALPAFGAGDEIDLSYSDFPEAVPKPKEGFSINVSGSKSVELPDAFHSLIAGVMKRSVINPLEAKETEIMPRGAGIIFHILPTNELVFFLRDDKSSIPYPNMVDIIGGRMEEEDGEDPKETAIREVAEELVDDETGEPFAVNPEDVELFRTFVDERPGEHNIFICRLNYIPRIHTIEGQGLVYLSVNDARTTNFAYGYNKVVQDYLETI